MGMWHKQKWGWYRMAQKWSSLLRHPICWVRDEGQRSRGSQAPLFSESDWSAVIFNERLHAGCLDGEFLPQSSIISPKLKIL